MRFCLKIPYSIYTVDSLILDSPTALYDSGLHEAHLTAISSLLGTPVSFCLGTLASTWALYLGPFFSAKSSTKSTKNVKNMALNRLKTTCLQCENCSRKAESSPCSTSTGAHVPRDTHTGPSAHVREWPQELREGWFWGYKKMLMSRWIHKHRICAQWGLTVLLRPFPNQLPTNKSMDLPYCKLTSFSVSAEPSYT